MALCCRGSATFWPSAQGTTSEEAAVTSSVPQGTVLGPLFFLAYINDLPACVSSEVRLFADDYLLHKTIKSQRDADILQDDLNILQQWEAKWLMSFNPDKCQVLRVTNKRKNIIQSQYTIHGTVDKTKYLGVTIHRKLNWKPHISNISKKANNIRAFLHRNLTRCPAPIKEQAYKTYVRPNLEYASTVWDPHTKELVDQLEMVTMLYRIHRQLVAIPPYIIYSNNPTRGYPLQLQQHHCCVNTYQHSFFPSVVNLWNKLPPNTVGAESLDQFQNLLAPLILR